jgi:hypothetical protein
MYDCFELSLEKEEMVDIILLCDKPTTTLPINCYISRVISGCCCTVYLGGQLKNKKIIFNIDNQSVVHIINKKSSKSVRVMPLVRHLVLSTLQYNIMIKALCIVLIPEMKVVIVLADKPV